MSISIPNSYVNPNVRTVGISKLRSLNATQLRDIDKTIVIQENDKPLAVLFEIRRLLGDARTTASSARNSRCPCRQECR